MLIVTHDMAVHANVAEKIAIMYAGKIVEIAEKKSYSPLQTPLLSILIQSLPRIGDKRRRTSAPGTPIFS